MDAEAVVVAAQLGEISRHGATAPPPFPPKLWTAQGQRSPQDPHSV